mmetsp:Transcript_4629/g.11208  ORF Transcript_4629/g.11208 Transcript_4629/m.11208 type:complete len:1411 (+) Transcript_4629:106-4338(+)
MHMRPTQRALDTGGGQRRHRSTSSSSSRHSTGGIGGGSIPRGLPSGTVASTAHGAHGLDSWAHDLGRHIWAELWESSGDRSINGDASEAVRVAGRVRPFVESDRQRPTYAITMSEQSVSVRTATGKEHFPLDLCFWSQEPGPGYGSQEEVFRKLGLPMVQSALTGYTSWLIAYGESGSGKSHSLLGARAEPGLLPRVMELLLQERHTLSNAKSSGSELRVWLSAIEIQNERLVDLLCPRGLSRADLRGKKTNSGISLLEHPLLGVQVIGVTESQCNGMTEFRQLLDFALKSRALAGTSVHSSSAKTHVIFGMRVELRQGRKVMQSRLNFVDLAGSERRQKSSRRAASRAGCGTSRSLALLGSVVRQLAKSKAPGAGVSRAAVPYGACKLTLALKDALAGNSRTCVFAALAPGMSSVEESVATLRFAQAASHLRTHPRIQPQAAGMSLINLLHAEVLRLQAHLLKHSDSMSLVNELSDRQWLIDELRRNQQPEAEAEERHQQQRLSRGRNHALEERGLLLYETEEAFAVDQVTPSLINISNDSLLAGRLFYFLRAGEGVVIGSDPGCTVTVNGLGVLPFMCEVMNTDNVRVCIRKGEGVMRHLLVNGAMVSPGEMVPLSHGDTIGIGGALLLRLHIPLISTVDTIDESEEQTGLRPPPTSHELCVPELLPTILAPLPQAPTFTQLTSTLGHSESFLELQLYVEDLNNKVVEETRRSDFFRTLQEACHLVDEANDITRVVRTSDCFHFEIEFVWDIYRDKDEMLMVRLMRTGVGPVLAEATNGQAPHDQDGVVVHYWTYAKFRERLDLMRDVFHDMSWTGSWDGRDDPLEDPWLDPDAADMHQRLVETSLVMEDRRLFLASLLHEAPPAERASGAGWSSSHSNHNSVTGTSVAGPSAGSRRTRNSSATGRGGPASATAPAGGESRSRASHRSRPGGEHRGASDTRVGDLRAHHDRSGSGVDSRPLSDVTGSSTVGRSESAGSLGSVSNPGAPDSPLHISHSFSAVAAAVAAVAASQAPAQADSSALFGNRQETPQDALEVAKMRMDIAILQQKLREALDAKDSVHEQLRQIAAVVSAASSNGGGKGDASSSGQAPQSGSQTPVAQGPGGNRLTWSSGEHSGEDESAELNSSKADASRKSSMDHAAALAQQAAEALRESLKGAPEGDRDVSQSASRGAVLEPVVAPQALVAPPPDEMSSSMASAGSSGTQSRPQVHVPPIPTTGGLHGSHNVKGLKSGAQSASGSTNLSVGHSSGIRAEVASPQMPYRTIRAGGVAGGGQTPGATSPNMSTRVIRSDVSTGSLTPMPSMTPSYPPPARSGMQGLTTQGGMMAGSPGGGGVVLVPSRESETPRHMQRTASTGCLSVNPGMSWQVRSPVQSASSQVLPQSPGTATPSRPQIQPAARMVAWRAQGR